MQSQQPHRAPNTGINEVLKANTEDVEICFKAGHYAYIQGGFQSVCQVSGSVPPILEDIVIKFVIYCADILHLKWNTIKLYLAGVQFHFIKAGYGKPLECCDKLSYIIKAVRQSLLN